MLRAIRRRDFLDRLGVDRAWRVSISTALIVGLCGIVLVGSGLVLGIGLWGAAQNTLRLLADKAELATNGLTRSLRQHLDPVSAGNAYLADLIARGEIDITDTVQLVDYMTAAMAATPQMLGIGFISADVEVIRVSRSAETLGTLIINGGDDPQFTYALYQARQRRGPFWGELIWNRDTNSTLLNLRFPIRRENTFVGVLVSTVSVVELSRFMGETQDGDFASGFILYGEDHVLAHRAMAAGRYARSETVPLPELDQIDDPVLADIWNPALTQKLVLTLRGATEGHVLLLDDGAYPVLYQRVVDYTDPPLIVGAYVSPGSGVNDELRRLRNMAVAGVLVLVLGVVAALLLGRGLSRPVSELASASRQIGALEFADLPELPQSRLRELDEAARAFNGMSGALGRFETYVPKKLVERLLSLGPDAGIASEMRDVTVMFTDIVGFTTLSESLGASETASLLNAHFTLLAEQIEATDGTLDKYIGDSVMAFWGPPFGAEDHAQNACEAAIAIRRALGADNARRAEAGLKPIKLRIGLHSGPAIVGNIGAPGRINYTLVGDTVNTAQRLEQLAKTAGDDQDTIILISEDVRARISGRLATRPLGEHAIRGRNRTVAVYAL